MELSMVKGQVGYGTHPVLEELDFSLEPGGCIGLIGPNGAGKSTLLKTLAGIQPPLGGQILLDGKALEQLPRPVLSRKIAFFLRKGSFLLGIRPAKRSSWDAILIWPGISRKMDGNGKWRRIVLPSWDWQKRLNSR